MNVNCIICSDPLTPTSDVYATPCGHVFHYHCLERWIKKAKTCPHCRSKTTEESIHRIYFNLANTDNIVDNADTLRFKLDNLQSEFNLREKDIGIYIVKLSKTEKQSSALRSTLHDLQNDAKISNSAIQALKEQIKYHKVKSKESDYLCEEISNLKDKLKELDDVVSTLSEANEQANNMLRHNRDPESLNILVSSLKKELMEAKRKSKHASDNLKETNNSLSHYKKELLKVQQENDKLKFDAEVHRNCITQQQHLKRKLSTLEHNSVKLPCRSIDSINLIEDNPDSHCMNKNPSFIDITKTVSPLNREKSAHNTAIKWPARGNDEFKIFKSSSAISKTKFRKLAPNKKLQESHTNDE